MSLGYSLKIIELNKAASLKLLGVRLGRLCIKQRIPVNQVAQHLGVSRQTIYNWFAGVSNPKTSSVSSVEQYLSSLRS
jgi:DNA-binding phage protein